MNLPTKLLSATLLSSATAIALAAGSPGVEHTTQAFLESLTKGGGKPLETLSPAEARQVLIDAQAGAKLPPADVSEKTITADGKPIKLNIVRPVGAKGPHCRYSCSSTAAAGSWATSRRTNALSATWSSIPASPPCS